MTAQPPGEPIPSASLSWVEANQRYLTAHLARIRAALEQHTGQAPNPVAEIAPVIAHDHPAALDTLCQMFDLSPFERDLLLLCAGVELEAIFAPLCAAAQGDPARDYPTFSLALAALPGAHWNALSPAAPLRHWQMLRIEPARALTLCPLRIDERILDYLMGIQHMEEGLAGLLRRVPAETELVPSHAALAREIAATWDQTGADSKLPVIQLCGPQVEDKRAVAAAACDLLGYELYLAPLMALPGDPGELDRMLRLWAREAALADSVLLIDCDGSDAPDPARENILARVVEAITGPASYGPLLLSSRERRGPWARPVITYEVEKPTGPEQRAVWHTVLGSAAPGTAALGAEALDGAVERIIAQFNLNPSVIAAAAQGALGHLAAEQISQPPEGAADASAEADTSAQTHLPQP